MKLKYNFITNEDAGKIVAVAVGESAWQFNGFIKMNSTGAKIFEILKEDVSKEELVLKLKEIYSDQTEDSLRQSAESFLGELEKAGVLIND